MNNIDLKLLRAFVVLMSEKSVSRTAERLGISQPATSHALARLRELFQDPLLLRTRAGMVPTERAGEIDSRCAACWPNTTLSSPVGNPSIRPRRDGLSF